MLSVTVNKIRRKEMNKTDLKVIIISGTICVVLIILSILEIVIV